MVREINRILGQRREGSIIFRYSDQRRHLQRDALRAAGRCREGECRAEGRARTEAYEGRELAGV